MAIDGVFNADRLIEFMESLVNDVPRKVFLAMDNLKVHHRLAIIHCRSNRKYQYEASRNIWGIKRLNGRLVW